MRSRRWIVISAVCLAVALLVAVAVLWAPRAKHRRERGPRVVTPTQAVEPTSTTEPTTTTSTVEPTSSPSQPNIKVWKSVVPVVFVRAGGLWISREDGRGTPRRVADFGDAASYLLSPDRKVLAYTRSAGRKKPLYVLNLRTGADTKIADDTDAFQGFPYAWSPGSDRIAFTLPIYSGSLHTDERIFTANADGGDRKLLASRAGAPAWGPGDRVVFRKGDVAHGSWRLYTSSANGGTATLVPSSNQATCYGWAPGRADLAFTVTQVPSAGGMSTVWVLKEGETMPQPLLEERLNKAAFVKLAWSPDGRLIAVAAGGDDGYSRVRVINAASGGASWQVQESRDDYLSGWSADATRLLYFQGNVFQGAPSNLWSVRRNGSARRLLVTDAAAQ